MSILLMSPVQSVGRPDVVLNVGRVVKASRYD